MTYLKEKFYKLFYKEREDALNEEITRLKERVNELVDELGDPRHVVSKLLKRDLGWYDYKDLPTDARKGYVQAADQVLRNETFRNEVNHLCADLINDIAKRSVNFEDVMYKRMTINGIQLIKDRLEELGVDSTPEQKHPFEPI
jgi:hypothetical protein